MHPRAEIVRYVADGTSGGSERELRAHIARCRDCKALYDQERLLHRALAGDVTRPTTKEEAAMVARALSVVAPTPTTSRAERRDARAAWSRMPIIFAAAASAVAILLFVVLGRGRGDEATAVIAPALAGHAVQVRGATANGVELTDGAPIHAFDAVRVKSDGLLEVAVDRGGTVRAFPGASFSMSPRGEVVALEQGKVWCVVDKGKGDFAVTTKEAVVHVVGTSFIVDEKNDGTDVRVVNGTVRVSDASEKATVTLKAEEGSHVAPNGSPSSPRPVSAAADISEWQRFFERLIKQIGEAVRQLGEKLHISGNR